MKKQNTLKTYKLSKEVIAKNEAFAKKVKATFIIIPSLLLLIYIATLIIK